MGTHGYLVMKSGNVARAIFVCSDARDIGDRLRAMSDDNIEQLWNGLGRIIGSKFSSSDLELVTDRTGSSFCGTTHVSAIYSRADIAGNKKRGMGGTAILFDPKDGRDANCYQFRLPFVPAMRSDITLLMFQAARAKGLEWNKDFAVLWVFDMDKNFIFHYGDMGNDYEYPKSKAELWAVTDEIRVMGQPRKPHPRSRQYSRTWKFAKDSDKVIYKGDLGERTARMLLAGMSKEKIADAGITVDM